ncbi:MAG TPA: NAD(+)/NADH kinase [Candidatus Omnitrophota bacterium]|nr:NAD(+)/NADH kinase [Candidatus Omnitrophota bacterium]
MDIGIIYKEEDALISGTAKKVAAELIAQKHRVEMIGGSRPPKKAGFVITFGGDGTVLRAARIVNVPILAVHLAGVGLLTEVPLLGLNAAIASIKKGKYRLDERMMLEAQVIRGGKKILDTFALNDVVIGKASIARTIKLEAFLGSTSIASYVGDGLVISTPTGSTAYNFAVNGPILPIHSRSYILSPICPHRAANRSIVIEAPVSVQIQKGTDNLLTVDGQETFKLKSGDTVIVRRSKMTTKFIRLKDYSLWELLRKKLGWIS